MDRLEARQQLQDLLQKDRDASAEFRDELNHYFVEKRFANIAQKKDYYKHLSLLSGIIIGLSSLVKPELLTTPYFLFGILTQILLIVFISLYVRESIDKEGSDLLKEQDKYNGYINEKLNLVDEYIKKISGDDFNENTASEYLHKHNELGAREALQKEVGELEKKRENRDSEPLDFTGEFFAFLFSIGTFLIGLSILEIVLPWWGLVLSLLIIYYATFGDTFMLIMKPISAIAQKLKRKKILFDSKNL